MKNELEEYVMQYKNFNLKKFVKKFYRKKIFELIKISQFSRTNPQNEKFNYPRIFKKSIVNHYVLNNNFFYTQLAFAFSPQIDSYYAYLFFYFS